MRVVLLYILAGFMIMACTKNVKSDESPLIQVNPIVQKWLTDSSINVDELLPVLVATSEPVKDFTFLRHVNGDFYSGHVTKKQLEKLIADPRIKEISSGTEQKH